MAVFELKSKENTNIETMSINGGFNKHTGHEMLDSVTCSQRNSIVKVEVKNELECAFVNVQNVQNLDIDDSLQNSMLTEATSVDDGAQDPLGSVQSIDVQKWPKLEFKEVTHDFNLSGTDLPLSIEELNNTHLDEGEPTYDTPPSNHFSTHEHFLTSSSSSSSSGSMNISLYVNENEGALISDSYQGNLGTHDSDALDEVTDQDFNIPRPVMVTSNFKKRKDVLPSYVEPTTQHCDSSTESASKAIYIYLKRSKNRYVCKLCNKEYVDLERCKGHISSHLGLKPFACIQENCTKAFPSKEALRSHVYLIHVAHDRFKCTMCDRTFNKRNLYVEHCNKHNAVMPFDCAECGKAFPSKDAIFVHIMDVHNRDNHRQSSLCPKCGKVFNNHQKLKCHLRTHGEKRFECDICNSKFRSRFKLANHKSSHSTERPFHCELCSKTYRLNTTLRRHVVTAHEKKKNHKCTTCGKSFVTGTFLREHELKHEGIRKYSCETCGKTFAQASHLCAHLFSHGEKKFVCPVCGARFNRHDNMKSHVKRHENKVKK